MTIATLDPGASPPGAPPTRLRPDPEAGARTAPRPRPADRSEIYAELALAGVTMAAVLGFGRLFSDWSFLVTSLGAAMLAHALASMCRRLGASGVWAIAVSVAGLGVFLAWAVVPGTTTYGLPGPSTWTAIQNELAAAWRQFATVVAPTPTTPGFTLAAATGGWLAAWLSDTFAFRAKVRIEAMVPAFTLFLFGAMLGGDRYRVALAATYLGAVVAFSLTATGAPGSGHTWFGSRTGDPRRHGRRVGAVIGLAAVVGGVILGPHLPGADAKALVGLRDKDKDQQSSRITVSPLVDIRGRLVDQSNTEVFTVASPSATYWRLTSLDNFDGSIWSSRGNYKRAKDSLPEGRATQGAETDLRQNFTISALASIWLPAAFRPTEIVSRAGGLRYDADTASLLTDNPTSDGLQYTINSSLPRLTAGELQASAQPLPAAVADRYLSLPASFPQSVGTLAERVTATADSPYERARSLQDWFRKNFTYSLDIPSGHGNRAIQEFIARRSGYCEQFAGTYAAMARYLGLPSRVAVGFTPGAQGDDGLFRVTGRNAHAWPEVYLSGYGWVAFEPTPGRGMPGAEDYTGVPAAQDSAGEAAPAPSDSAPSSDAPPTPVPTTVPSSAGQSPAGTAQPPANEPKSPGPSVLSRIFGSLAALVVLLTLAALVGVPALKRARRARRRSIASSPASQVLAAWHDADDGLGILGLSRFETETLSEHARRAAAATRGGSGSSAAIPLSGATVASAGVTAAALSELAAAATAATWSPDGVPQDSALQARTAADTVIASMRTMTTRARRLTWALDPRPLFHSRG